MSRIRLQSLKLAGFKSFPDEVELNFPPGKMSAIIGPNGCGKSNVVDAILWVLGEQSPSLMRLKQMGDVVFSGASSRPAAGAAEVTLILESDDGHWKETDGRLEVRRRVFRNGPSEYRINGRAVRLKDVFDELAGVGLGTRAYSIIEQGRVGQVLSARPIDRRALLEEAAGITRYKARKHEAELKLEHTRQNLLRLDDVIGEVNRTLRQIKRQAKQAERHQKLETELKEHLRCLFTIDAHRLDGQRTDITRRRAQAQNEVAAAAAALGGSDADLGRAREELEAARRETDAAREEVATLLGSRERLEAFLERSADMLDNLRASLDHTKTESTTLTSARGAIEERIADANARHGKLESELESIRKDLDEAKKGHGAADARLQTAEEAASRQRQDLLRTISTLTGSRNRLGDLERERDRLTYALGQLDQERTRLETRRQELGESVREASDRSRTAAQAAEKIAARRRKLADDRAGLREQASTAKREAELLGHTLWELRHRLQGVERGLARQAAAAEQLSGVIPADLMAGKLGDYLHPPADLAPVLDRTWREWLELPVVHTADLSPDQLDGLSELEGRIRLVATGDTPPPPKTVTPDGAEDLLQLAGAASENLGWLARSLPPTYRCSDLARAQQIANEHPEAIILCPDGVLRQGRILEPATAGGRHPGALQLRTTQGQLQAQIEETAARTEASSDRHGEINERLERLSTELATLDGDLVTAEQERARTAAVDESVTQDLGRIERELESLTTDKERCRTQDADIAERLTRLEKEVGELEERSHELEQAELDRWRAEERLAAERVETAHSEGARLEGEAGALSERVGALAAEAGRLAGERQSTEDEVVRSRTRLAEEQGLLAAAREQERRLAEKVDATSTRVSALEKEVRIRRETHEQEREVLHGIEVEQTRAEGDWERLREHAADELSLAPETTPTMTRRAFAPTSTRCAPSSNVSGRSISLHSRSWTSLKSAQVSSRTSATTSWRPCVPSTKPSARSMPPAPSASWPPSSRSTRSSPRPSARSSAAAPRASTSSTRTTRSSRVSTSRPSPRARRTSPYSSFQAVRRRSRHCRCCSRSSASNHRRSVSSTRSTRH